MTGPVGEDATPTDRGWPRPQDDTFGQFWWSRLREGDPFVVLITLVEVVMLACLVGLGIGLAVAL